MWHLLRARSSLTFRQTIECGFTLKLVRDMITTYRLLIQIQKLLLVREWHKLNVKYLILLVQLLTLSSSRKLNKLKENAEFVKKANLNTKISTAVTKLATKGEITMCENRCFKLFFGKDCFNQNGFQNSLVFHPLFNTLRWYTLNYLKVAL